MMQLRALLPLLVVMSIASPALASDPIGPAKPAGDDTPPAQSAAGATTAGSKFEPVHIPASLKPVPMPATLTLEPPTRGRALPTLYGSYAALQAYDVALTLRGVQLGGAEANPMMSGFSRNPAAMWALKGGVTVASIYTAERLWKQRRRGEAIAVMAVANAVMAGVALHNASTLNGLR